MIGFRVIAGTRRHRWQGVGRLVLISALAACSPMPRSPSPDTPAEPSGQPSAAPSGTAIAFAGCPEEVTVVMVIVPACGFLTVPERRDKPGGPTIRILVIRIEPAGGIEASDPMVVVGETLGARIEYGGLVQLAQRTGRLVYIVDRRGTGLSEPALDCPEVMEASRDSLSVGSRDPRAEALLVDAVGACRDRLTAAGVDLATYGLRESAQDIEAVRVALGHEPWNVIGFGSASRLAVEVARAAPAGVRTVVMDSPVLPQGPDPMFAAAATKNAIDNVELACVAEPACAGQHPDVPRALSRAVELLDAQPVVISILIGRDADPVDVVIDGVRFARGARSLLAGQGGASIDELLDSIEAAKARRLTATDPVVQAVTLHDAICLGYTPDCTRVVTGSLLTTACGDVLPVVDRDIVLALGADVPGMAGLFETNPFFAACEVWAVPADPDVAQPIETAIPSLAMVGRFDPFTGPSTDLVMAAGFEDAIVLEVPRHSYNVFGYNECPRQVRREWLDHPDHVPDASCFADLRTVDLSR
jgi:pimeloyl-ACP methyl ester carboxylesterase